MIIVFFNIIMFINILEDLFEHFVSIKNEKDQLESFWKQNSFLLFPDDMHAKIYVPQITYLKKTSTHINIFCVKVTAFSPQLELYFFQAGQKSHFHLIEDQFNFLRSLKMLN